MAFRDSLEKTAQVRKVPTIKIHNTQWARSIAYFLAAVNWEYLRGKLNSYLPRLTLIEAVEACYADRQHYLTLKKGNSNSVIQKTIIKTPFKLFKTPQLLLKSFNYYAHL